MTTVEQKQAKIASQAIIEAAKEIIKMGASAEQAFDAISKVVGKKGARFVLANIALEQGLVNETKKYLAKF